MHTPFAALAKQIKKLNPNTKICLIVPDLPEYMNLREKKSWLYRIGKIFDIRAFDNTLKYFDYFAYVSIHQNNRINKYNKKYMVIEYLTDEPTCEFSYEVKAKKRIVYTGALNFKFNIENLVKAFERIHTEAELIICGDGDATEYIKSSSKRNSNIVYCGVVPHEKVLEIQKHADVLVNPRLNQDDYTRYSFPSKTVEYMRTGHPVICYKLAGISDEYDRYLEYPSDNSIESLTEKIDEVLGYSEEKLLEIHNNSISFLRENKTSRVLIKKLLSLMDS